MCKRIFQTGIWGVILVAALSTFVTACSAAITPAALTATPVQSKTAELTPKSAIPSATKGGKLTIVYAIAELKSLDADIFGTDYAAVICSWVSDTLVGADKDGSFKPYLATQWQVSEDGKTWTFKLRKDVKFHDGTPFNAEAVKFKFERILDPKTQSQKTAMLGPVSSMEVLDEYTFRITHKEPFPQFLDSISTGYFAMWSPTAVNKYGLDDFQRHLVGTGPFVLKEHKPGDRYVFAKNPDYNWAPSYMKHQGPAYLDEVTIRFVAEAATSVAVFKSGEADIVIRFPAQHAPDYRNNPKYQVLDAPFTGSPVLFVMNTMKPPLDDLKVRKAIEHAVNQGEIVKAVWRGEAIVARGVMYPNSPCYWREAEQVYPYDVKRAKTLLEEDGWRPGADGINEKDGKKLQITIVNHNNYQEIGPPVQAQLKEIGVDAKIEVVPGAIQNERAANGDFHMIFQHMAYSDPGVLDLLYNSKNAKPGGWAWSRYADPKLDELLNKSATTIDMGKRCQLLTEAQKIVVNNALVLPLYGRIEIAVMAPTVKGFSFGPRPNVDEWLYDTYVEKN